MRHSYCCFRVLFIEPLPMSRIRRGNITTADCWIDHDSRESGKMNSYCRFWLVYISTCSRMSWFCWILLSSDCSFKAKTAVSQRHFPFPTVSSRKSSLITTVWIIPFGFCTVILRYLGSRKLKKQDKNCHPGSRPTAQKRLILLPTVDPTVTNTKSRYELSPRISTNSTNKTYPVSYCRPNSPKVTK